MKLYVLENCWIKGHCEREHMPKQRVSYVECIHNSISMGEREMQSYKHGNFWYRISSESFLERRIRSLHRAAAGENVESLQLLHKVTWENCLVEASILIDLKRYDSNNEQGAVRFPPLRCIRTWSEVSQFLILECMYEINDPECLREQSRWSWFGVNVSFQEISL